MRKHMFICKEDGAVTVDFIAITAIIISLALSMTTLLGGSVQTYAEKMSAFIADGGGYDFENAGGTSSGSSDSSGDAPEGDSSSDDASDTSASDDAADNSATGSGGGSGGTGSGAGSGNPGNDKDVGKAGEDPSGKGDRGHGGRGRSG